MLDKIKSELSFVGIPIGGTQTMAHGLVMSDAPLAPDEVKLQFPGAFEVVASDTISLTIRNVGSAVGNCVCLLETWHPIERMFGSDPGDGSFQHNLTPRPFTSGAVSQSGIAADVVVFRPGGVATENVVTTWDQAVAKLGQLQGIRTLEFDDSLSSPIVIPAGGPYDMTNVIWSGSAGTEAPSVHVQEGASFTKLRQFDNRVFVTFTGTTPPVSDFDVTSLGPDTIFIDHGAMITTSGAGPFFRLSMPAVSGVVLAVQVGGVLATGTNAVIDLAVPGAVLVLPVAGGFTDVQSGTISGVVGSTCVMIVGAAGIVQASEDQPAFLGTLVPQNVTKERRYPTQTLAAPDQVLTETSQLVIIDATVGFTITLPAAFNHRGESISLKIINALPAPMVIAAAPGDTIDGAASAAMATPFAFMQVTSDGVSSWWITGP